MTLRALIDALNKIAEENDVGDASEVAVEDANLISEIIEVRLDVNECHIVLVIA